MDGWVDGWEGDIKRGCCITVTFITQEVKWQKSIDMFVVRSQQLSDEMVKTYSGDGDSVCNSRSEDGKSIDMFVVRSQQFSGDKRV